jgi:hypothetical protein
MGSVLFLVQLKEKYINTVKNNNNNLGSRIILRVADAMTHES